MEFIKLTPSVLASGMYGVASSAGFNYNYGKIYSGTPISQSALDGLTTVASIDAAMSGMTLLVDIAYGTTSASSSGATLRFIDSPYTAAKASGIATWFIIYGTNYIAAPGSNIQATIMGTVSDAVGNGDLRLQSTSITQGSLYRINAMTIALNNEYTY